MLSSKAPAKLVRYQAGVHPIRRRSGDEDIIFDPTIEEVDAMLDSSNRVKIADIGEGREPRVPLGYKLSDSAVAFLLLCDQGYAWMAKHWRWSPPTRTLPWESRDSRMTVYKGQGYFGRNQDGTREVIAFRFYKIIDPFFCCGTLAKTRLRTWTGRDTGVNINITIDTCKHLMSAKIIHLDDAGKTRRTENQRAPEGVTEKDVKDFVSKEHTPDDLVVPGCSIRLKSNARIKGLRKYKVPDNEVHDQGGKRKELSDLEPDTSNNSTMPLQKKARTERPAQETESVPQMKVNAASPETPKPQNLQASTIGASLVVSKGIIQDTTGHGRDTKMSVISAQSGIDTKSDNDTAQPQLVISNILPKSVLQLPVAETVEAKQTIVSASELHSQRVKDVDVKGVPKQAAPASPRPTLGVDQPAPKEALPNALKQVRAALTGEVHSKKSWPIKSELGTQSLNINTKPTRPSKRLFSTTESRFSHATPALPSAPISSSTPTTRPRVKLEARANTAPTRTAVPSVDEGGELRYLLESRRRIGEAFAQFKRHPEKLGELEAAFREEYMMGEAPWKIAEFDRGWVALETMDDAGLISWFGKRKA